jgi:beta-lactamase regulating signal transducer with metallopeptidase domain/protocatechuate 3,4-dioxygenase beta subunit
MGGWNDAIGWQTLAIEAAAKGTVVLAVAGVMATGLRRAPGASRHALWVAALAAVLLLPLLIGVVPGWHIAIWRAAVPEGAMPAEAAIGSSERVGAVEKEATGKPVREVSGPPVERNVSGMNSAVARSGTNLKQRTGWSRANWTALTAGVWALVAGVGLLGLALAPLAVRRLKWRTRQVDAGGIANLLETSAKEMGVSRRVRLRVHEERCIPLTFGLLRPTIVLPADCENWPADRVRMALLHELAHIRRGDGWTLLLAQVTCALHWYQPLVWLAAHQMWIECESACDERVLEAGVRPPDYAEALVGIAMGRGGRMPRGMLAMARGSLTERRVRNILKRRPRHSYVWLPAILCLVLSIALAMVRGQSTSPGAAIESTGEIMPLYTFTGTVVDANGNGVSGASIRRESGLKLRLATSDASGHFVMQAESSGVFVAEAADRSTIGWAPASRMDGDLATPVRIVLKAPRLLSVEVSGATGERISGATILVAGGYSEIASAQTDEKGAAVLRVPPDAPLNYILAMKAGEGLDYALFWNEGQVHSDPYRLDSDARGPVPLVLNGAKRATVRVRDDEGRPVIGATVAAWVLNKPGKGDSLNLAFVSSPNQETGTDGTALFPWIPADNTSHITFWVFKAGYIRQARFDFDPAGSGREVLATIKKMTRISGRVLGIDGAPVAGAEILIGGADYGMDDFRQSAPLKSAGDGTFSGEVDPEKYYLFAARKGTDIGHFSSLVLKTPTRPIEIRMQPGQRLSGEVTQGPNHDPVAHARLSIVMWDDDSYQHLSAKEKQLPLPTGESPGRTLSPHASFPTTSDGSGRYEAYVLPLRGYVDYNAASERVIGHYQGTAEQQIRVDIHANKAIDTVPLVCQVIEAGKPGSAVAAVNVSVEYLKDLETLGPSGTSNNQGRLNIARPIGDYYVLALSADRTRGTIRRGTPSEDPLVIEVSPTGAVRGRLLDGEGKPQPGVMVTWETLLKLEDGGWISSYRNAMGGTTRTDSEGRFVANGMIVGREYRINTAITDRYGNPRTSQHIQEYMPAKAGSEDLGDLTPSGPTTRP